jgi:membrane fusion protein, heavy metal efflux system
MIRIKLIISLGLLLVCISNCNTQATKEAGSETTEQNGKQYLSLTDTQVKNAEIAWGKISTKAVSRTIRASGLLDVPPQNLISISALYGGILKSTNLLQGLHVHKGEVIAQMEHPDYIQLQQDYLESSSQLQYLKDEYNRQLELSKEEVNSKKTLQKAKMEYEVTQAKVHGLRAKLNQINVDISKLEKGDIQKTIQLVSPINGYVTKVNANIGSFVNANTTLFEIVDTEHLHAEIRVYEKNLSEIAVGQQVTFTLANETVERHAKVYLIGREISADRTIRIHCHLNEEDNSLLPGMYLTAHIHLKNSLTNVLPEQAVVNYEGKSYVFYKNASQNGNQVFTRVEVETTGSENNLVAISCKEDLTNKEIVVKGSYQLLAAMMNEEE